MYSGNSIRKIADDDRLFLRLETAGLKLCPTWFNDILEDELDFYGCNKSHKIIKPLINN